eukprot:771269-Pelagomonas_calceolata.AAC.3
MSLNPNPLLLLLHQHYSKGSALSLATHQLDFVIHFSPYLDDHAQLLPKLRAHFGPDVELTLSKKAEALAHVRRQKYGIGRFGSEGQWLKIIFDCLPLRRKSYSWLFLPAEHLGKHAQFEAVFLLLFVDCADSFEARSCFSWAGLAGKYYQKTLLFFGIYTAGAIKYEALVCAYLTVPDLAVLEQDAGRLLQEAMDKASVLVADAHAASLPKDPLSGRGEGGRIFEVPAAATSSSSGPSNSSSCGSETLSRGSPCLAFSR